MAERQMGPLKSLDDFTLTDLESLWLILRGGSVIDWRRLHYQDEAEAAAFLASQGYDGERNIDRERIEHIKATAIDYLRRQFDFPIPRPLERATTLELLRVASGKGHRQLCACAILKAMHIIHHVEARELLYSLAMSDQELFQLVEERVYRLVGHMLADGLPITEFVGGRKRRDSVYTKLLSKREAHASAIYDKLRFRLVTRTKDDILPVLLYLAHHLFPFNHVVPAETVNTIFHFRSYCQANERLASLHGKLQQSVADDLNESENQFSAASYRILHFVVDLPVRVPDDALLRVPPRVRAMGPIIFGLSEFQIVDQQTEEANEIGDASHASYKARQREAVMERLKLGARKTGRGDSPSQRGRRGS
jgi:uncharacterized protein (TIGR04552 family)